MTSIGTKARLMSIAVVFLVPAFAQAGAWSSPVALSTGGQGFEAAAAMDGSGNSLALWDEITTLDQLWSRARPNGGSWGSVTEVSPALQSNSVFPALRISATGFATAVWSDNSGIWTADRPAASQWDAAQLLIPGASNPIFAMNSQGAAVIVWTAGDPPASGSSVLAVVRPAGGVWSSQQTIASGKYVTADHAAIGDNGAAIATWETYNAVCKKYYCSLNSFVLHASRQNTGSGAWVDSGALLGPDGAGHDARAALDLAGGAVLVALNSSGAYGAATQGISGGAWSAFKTIIASPQGFVMITDLAADDAGQVTLVYEFIGFSTSQIFAVGGSIGNNVWSAPVVLSGGDTTVGSAYFAVSPGGPAVTVWVTGGATPQVHAVVRATGTAAWSAPVTISGAGSELSPEAAAVSSSGDALVVFSAYDASGVHTEYATNYQP
jgi:hypothetical protein